MRWMIGLLGLCFAGCEGPPAYTIEVQNVPAGATQLEVRAYAQGILAKNTPIVPVEGPRDSFTFGLNLGPALSGDPKVSVAARRDDGCILAVGTSAASAAGSSNVLSLVAPDPAVNDSVCKGQPPLILSAIRRQEGPLTNMRSSMLLYGWGFEPTTEVHLQSPFPVECDQSDAGCVAACPTETTCSFKQASDGSTVTVPCRTDCVVQAEVVHTGPALIELNFDSSKNFLKEGTFVTSGTSGMSMTTRSIDLLQLLSGPLNVTLTLPSDSTFSLKYSEIPMKGPTMQ